MFFVARPGSGTLSLSYVGLKNLETRDNSLAGQQEKYLKGVNSDLEVLFLKNMKYYSFEQMMSNTKQLQKVKTYRFLQKLAIECKVGDKNYELNERELEEYAQLLGPNPYFYKVLDLRDTRKLPHVKKQLDKYREKGVNQIDVDPKQRFKDSAQEGLIDDICDLKESQRLLRMVSVDAMIYFRKSIEEYTLIIFDSESRQLLQLDVVLECSLEMFQEEDQKKKNIRDLAFVKKAQRLLGNVMKDPNCKTPLVKAGHNFFVAYLCEFQHEYVREGTVQEIETLSKKLIKNLHISTEKLESKIRKSMSQKIYKLRHKFSNLANYLIDNIFEKVRITLNLSILENRKTIENFLKEKQRSEVLESKNKFLSNNVQMRLEDEQYYKEFQVYDDAEKELKRNEELLRRLHKKRYQLNKILKRNFYHTKNSVFQKKDIEQGNKDLEKFFEDLENDKELKNCDDQYFNFKSFQKILQEKYNNETKKETQTQGYEKKGKYHDNQGIKYFSDTFFEQVILEKYIVKLTSLEFKKYKDPSKIKKWIRNDFIANKIFPFVIQKGEEKAKLLELNGENQNGKRDEEVYLARCVQKCQILQYHNDKEFGRPSFSILYYNQNYLPGMKNLNLNKFFDFGSQLKLDHVTSFSSQFLKIFQHEEQQKRIEIVVPVTFETRTVPKKKAEYKVRWTNIVAVRFMKLELPDPSDNLEFDKFNVKCTPLEGQSLYDINFDNISNQKNINQYNKKKNYQLIKILEDRQKDVKKPIYTLLLKDGCPEDKEEFNNPHDFSLEVSYTNLRYDFHQSKEDMEEPERKNCRFFIFTMLQRYVRNSLLGQGKHNFQRSQTLKMFKIKISNGTFINYFKQFKSIPDYHLSSTKALNYLSGTYFSWDRRGIRKILQLQQDKEMMVEKKEQKKSNKIYKSELVGGKM